MLLCECKYNSSLSHACLKTSARQGLLLRVFPFDIVFVLYDFEDDSNDDDDDDDR